MAKKANKKEKALTKIEQKRVDIAKDALSQVKAEKYTVLSSNGYVESGKLEDIINKALDSCELFTGKKAEDVELKTYIDTAIKIAPCEVCAKGALFLSSIRKFNNFSLAEARDSGLNESASYKIQEIFGEENADRIEEYFEKNDPTYGENYENQWSDKYPDDKDRLIAILKNVIANKGTFIPVKE